MERESYNQNNYKKQEPKWISDTGKSEHSVQISKKTFENSYHNKKQEDDVEIEIKQHKKKDSISKDKDLQEKPSLIKQRITNSKTTNKNPSKSKETEGHPKEIGKFT